MGAKVLIIEDDEDIRDLVALHLERASFAIRAEGTAQAGWQTFVTWQPDVVILDLMLPDGHGFDLCRRMREAGKSVGILILTALTDEADQVAGLELGADDYVPKPFRPRELVARVRAVLRRLAPTTEARRLLVGPLVLDPGRMAAVGEGTAVALTAMEFAILSKLAEKAGMVFTRRQLLDQVWGEDFVGDERTVDVHVRHIRAKLEPHHLAGLIDTVRGVGYRLKDVP